MPHKKYLVTLTADDEREYLAGLVSAGKRSSALTLTRARILLKADQALGGGGGGGGGGPRWEDAEIAQASPRRWTAGCVPSSSAARPPALRRAPRPGGGAGPQAAGPPQQPGKEARRRRPAEARLIAVACCSTPPPPPPPGRARWTLQAWRIAQKLEWHYTPKHGSWLNMAEIEWAALSKQCLGRRIGSQEELEREVAAWEEERNERQVAVKWQFTTAKARVKLHRLYPSTQ
jgi:DDE superfamily endonuclease